MSQRIRRNEFSSFNVNSEILHLPTLIRLSDIHLNTATMTSQVKASSSIPYAYRFLLLNVESLFALNGAALVFFQAKKYLSTMTRGAISSAQPSTSFIYTELAGGWLHFAFTEGVVLRLVDDLRVWRLLCFGMLLSDVMYCHSCAEALGGWNVWLRVAEWTVEDWVVTLSTWPFVFVRLAIVLGIGINESKPDERKV